jgi:dihydrofolate reductase
MRQVVLQFWISLDGYSFDEGTEIYRVMEEITDAEQEDYFASRLRHAGTHIMGRVTYQEMAEFWPASAPAEAGARRRDHRPRWHPVRAVSGIRTGNRPRFPLGKRAAWQGKFICSQGDSGHGLEVEIRSPREPGPGVEMQRRLHGRPRA